MPNFTYDSYFHLRQVEQIGERGFPLYQDGLSYGGRTLVFLPAFHYVMAFFDLFLPLEMVAKVIPNLLLSLCVILIYLIAKKISKSKQASLFSAFLAGFVPILWQTNSFNPVSLFLPLTFLAIYSFMNLQKREFVYLYIVVMFLLSLTSSATFLLIVGLFFYLFFSKLEEKRMFLADLEISLFSLFLFLWLQFLFFKQVLLTEGLSFIWQNIPLQIISNYFPENSLLVSLVLVGLVPLLAGVSVIYYSFFKEKQRNVFLVFSLAISIICLTLLNLIEIKVALMFFGLILAILFSQFYNYFLNYIQQTKLIKLKKVLLGLMLVLIALASVYPSWVYAGEQETPSAEDIKAFEWLEKNTPEKAVVLATLKEGHLLTYAAKRKNLMDDQFSLIDQIEKRFDDFNLLFVTKSQTQAIDLLNLFEVNYIFFSPRAKEEYDLNNINYIDKKCFDLLYSNTVQIYKTKCQLEKK